MTERRCYLCGRPIEGTDPTDTMNHEAVHQSCWFDFNEDVGEMGQHA